mgnify:CR=1 FL=1
MKKLLMLAALMLVASPAMAEKLLPDEATAETLTQCAVMFTDQRELAAKDNAPEEAKVYETAAAAYSITAMAYMPGDDEEQVRGKLEAWKQSFENKLPTMAHEDVQKLAQDCDALDPKVRAVVEALRAAQGQ